MRKNIFQNIILGSEKNKTRILVTHAIDFIHKADKIIYMESGKIVHQGVFEEIKEKEEIKELLEIQNKEFGD